MAQPPPGAMPMPPPGQQGQPNPMMFPRPGQQPTPEQMAALQRQLAIDAEKNGMTVPQFIEEIKKQTMQQRMMMMQQQQQQQAQQQQGGQQQPGHQGHQHGPNGEHQHQHPPPQQQQQMQGQQPNQPQPIQPGPPTPAALALAKFLKGQDLKPRTCILNGERRDMFRVKRALRALESDAYKKYRLKNPILPEITDRSSLENCFKLLPISMLALRVEKMDPHEGHNHAPPPKKGKRVKGQWTIRVVPQQDVGDDMYYAWLWEGSQWKRKVYGAIALAAIFAIVCYPLWPLFLRQGVYYCSWGFLGLLGLFFAMAIFRLLLFGVTYFAYSPGLWLYPNLWEDVSFMDSFRPVWAWHETEKKKKKSKSKSHKAAGGGGGSGGGIAAVQAGFAGATGQPLPASATTTATDTQILTQQPQQRAYTAPRVEEVEDDD